MNPREDYGTVCRFTPHLSDACKLPVLISFAAGIGACVFLLVKGNPERLEMALSCMLIGVSLIAMLYGWRRNRRTVCEITRSTVRVASPGREKTMKLGALDRVEVCRGVFSGILGSMRVRIYSQAAQKAWLSVRLSEKDCEALIRSTVPLGRETGRTLSGRYSTVAYALASERTVVPVVVSLQFTLLAGKNAVMNLFAFMMLSLALWNMLVIVLSSYRLSLVRYGNGCRVSMGTVRYKSIFIPESSLTGAEVRRSPAELLCGTGSVGLVTACGRKIPCMRMLPAADILPAVRRILDTEGKAFVSFCDEKALFRQYAVKFTSELFSAVLAAIFTFMTDVTILRFLSCMGFSAFSLAAIGSLAGTLCVSRLGLKVSPSFVLSAGTVGCCCVALCVRRHMISGIQTESPLLWQMDDLCRAGLLTGFGASGVWSRGVAYDALKAFACRFG